MRAMTYYCYRFIKSTPITQPSRMICPNKINADIAANKLIRFFYVAYKC